MDWPLCVFWDTSCGRWSKSGCRTVSTNSSHTGCHCDHLSSFAVLVNLARGPEVAHSTPQVVLTYIGCLASSVCLILTGLTFLYFQKVRSVRNTVHAHLSACLCCAHVTFMVGGLVESVAGLCYTMSIVTHYLFLCAVNWMLVEGLELYFLFLQPIRFNHFIKSRRNVLYVCTCCYVSPIAVILLTVVCIQAPYNSHDYCWLNAFNGATYFFSVPIIVMFFFNFGGLAVAVYMMLAHSLGSTAMQSRSMPSRCSMWTKGTFMMVSVLGLCWIIGLFDVHHNTVVFSYLFILSSSTQGVSIFILNCASTEPIVEEYCRYLRGLDWLPDCLKPSITYSEIVRKQSVKKQKSLMYTLKKDTTTDSGKHRVDTLHILLGGLDTVPDDTSSDLEDDDTSFSFELTDPNNAVSTEIGSNYTVAQQLLHHFAGSAPPDAVDSESVEQHGRGAKKPNKEGSEGEKSSTFSKVVDFVVDVGAEDSNDSTEYEQTFQTLISTFSSSEKKDIPRISDVKIRTGSIPPDLEQLNTETMPASNPLEIVKNVTTASVDPTYVSVTNAESIASEQYEEQKKLLVTENKTEREGEAMTTGDAPETGPKSDDNMHEKQVPTPSNPIVRSFTKFKFSKLVKPLKIAQRKMSKMKTRRETSVPTAGDEVGKETVRPVDTVSEGHTKGAATQPVSEADTTSKLKTVVKKLRPLTLKLAKGVGKSKKDITEDKSDTMEIVDVEEGERCAPLVQEEAEVGRSSLNNLLTFLVDDSDRFSEGFSIPSDQVQSVLRVRHFDVRLKDMMTESEDGENETVAAIPVRALVSDSKTTHKDRHESRGLLFPSSFFVDPEEDSFHLSLQGGTPLMRMSSLTEDSDDLTNKETKSMLLHLKDGAMENSELDNSRQEAGSSRSEAGHHTQQTRSLGRQLVHDVRKAQEDVQLEERDSEDLAKSLFTQAQRWARAVTESVITDTKPRVRFLLDSEYTETETRAGTPARPILKSEGSLLNLFVKKPTDRPRLVMVRPTKTSKKVTARDTTRSTKKKK